MLHLCWYYIFTGATPKGLLGVARSRQGVHEIGCGSTAYCYLSIWRDEQILKHKETPIGRVPISHDIAGPCPAECTGLRIATETRPTHNTRNGVPEGALSNMVGAPKSETGNSPPRGSAS
jgi:hypothetical protein